MSMRKTLKHHARLVAVLATGLLLHTPVLAADPSGDVLVLDRVVLVQRHGVRAPTKPAAAYARYASQPWPEWPVGVAELTPHGADNVRAMGAWLRARYASLGSWEARACPDPDSVVAWGDGADQRTRESAQATLEGAFPGCGLTARHGPAGQTDPLFAAVESGACPLNATTAKAALEAAAGDLDHGPPALDMAKAALYDILTPPGERHNCTDERGTCFLFGRNTLADGKEGAKLEGPLATASTLTENLFLEYTQGMPADQVGWGRADAAAITAVMPIHNYVAALARQTPYLASHNGALMARTVLAALQGLPALPATPPGARLTVISGHDTTLSNLAGILGVSWQLPEQPDNTPPGATLGFEIWHDAARGQYVRLVLDYQTLDQLRRGPQLGDQIHDDPNAAHQLALPLPGCDDGPQNSCPLARFVERVESVLPATCQRPN